MRFTHGTITLNGAQSTVTGGVTAGSQTVTTTNTTGLFVGQTITGFGIPEGAIITGITPGSSFTISAPATLTSTSSSMRVVTTQAVNLTGTTPTIKLGYSIANGDAADATANSTVNMNAHLTGSNGLRIETVSPNAVTGRLVVGSTSSGGSLPNQLTGGITIGNKTTLDAQVASNAAYNSVLGATSSNNPLGNNRITLEAGGGLDLRGTKSSTGISGRLFNIPTYSDASRIDFTQAATGETIPSQSFLSTGAVGQNVLTVTNTAVLAAGQSISGIGIPAGAQVQILSGTTIGVVNSLNQPLNITAANPTITVLPTQPSQTLPTAPFFNTLAPQGDGRTSIRYVDANGTTQTVSNYAVQYVGNLNLNAAGNYTIFARSDDAARVYVDGVLVLNNDGGKGSTDLSSAPIPLGAGTHEIRVDYVQGTGGGLIELAYARSTGVNQVNDARQTLVGSTLNGLSNAETLSATTASGAITLGNAVRLTGNASLDIRNTSSPSFIMGPLQLDNSVTLSSRLKNDTFVEQAAGGDGFGPAIRFGGTAADPSLLGHTGTSGTVSIFANNGIAFDGVVSDGGRDMTLVKTGVGRLFFSGTTEASGLGAGTTIEMVGTSLSGATGNTTAGSSQITTFNTNTNPVYAGMTVTGANILPGTFITQVTNPGTSATLSLSTVPTSAATGASFSFSTAPSLVLTGGSAAGSANPIGSAAIKLNGGNLFLDSKGVNSRGFGATFANNIDVVKSAFIRSMQNNATITLGGTQVMTGTTNGTATVTVASTAGLRVGQPVSGAGIPAGARIAAIVNGTSYTLTSPATSSVTNGNLTYGTVVNLTAGQNLVLDAIAGGTPAGAANPGATLKVESDIVGAASTTLTIRSTVVNGGTTITVGEGGNLGTPQRTGNNAVARGVVALSGNNSQFLGSLNFEPDAGLRLEGVDSLNSRTFSLNQNNTLTLAADGDGTGGNQVFNFNHNINVIANNTLAVERVGTDFSPYYALAQNKTMQINSLSTGRNTVVVANNHGFNLQVNDTTTLGGGTTIQVNNFSDSNLLSGLRLSGVVGGSGNLLKSGSGTLSLENSGNTFGSSALLTGTNIGPSGVTPNTFTTQSVQNLVAGQLVTVNTPGSSVPANTRIASVNVQNIAGFAAASTATLTVSIDPSSIFAVGMPVSGTGIPSGTVIQSINTNVTNTGTGTSGGNTVTVTGGTGGAFRVGDTLVAATGIPAGTYVLAVNGISLQTTPR